jgi:hypothetical protein
MGKTSSSTSPSAAVLSLTSLFHPKQSERRVPSIGRNQGVEGREPRRESESLGDSLRPELMACPEWRSAMEEHHCRVTQMTRMTRMTRMKRMTYEWMCPPSRLRRGSGPAGPGECVCAEHPSRWVPVCLCGRMDSDAGVDECCSKPCLVGQVVQCGLDELGWDRGPDPLSLSDAECCSKPCLVGQIPSPLAAARQRPSASGQCRQDGFQPFQLI